MANQEEQDPLDTVVEEDSSWRVFSEEYESYQEAEQLSLNTRYERWGHKLGSIRKINLEEIPMLGRLFEPAMEDIQQQLRVARMEVDSGDIGAMLLLPILAMMPPFIVLSSLFPAPLSFMIWGIPIFWAYWVISYPSFKSTVMRIKSADEALRIILYMAMQLNMNPGLEGAVRMAAQHTNGPVGRDLAKILWDTETNKYPNVKQAISSRMKLWREWSADFVKSFEFLVDATSRVGEGRQRLIDKGQDNMIESTKNNMKQYARNLSSPVKVLHMAGIMLPLMGIIMFPLITIFLSGENASVLELTSYLAFGYTVILPLFLFFIVKRLIATRPGAYSPPDIQNVRNLPPKGKYPLELPSGNRVLIPLLPTAILVAVIVMAPGLYFYTDLLAHMVALNPDALGTGNAGQWEEFVKQQYDVANAVPNVVKGLTVFWGTSAGLIIYFVGRSYPRLKIRKEVEQIEQGIETGLVAMENSLAKNMPVEWSAYDVVKEYEKMGEADHPMHGFFGKLLNNLERNIPFERAVFGDEGAIHHYPSSLLHSVMQVIVNSRNKGADAMADNIRTLNEYINNQQRVEELIKELLDETVSQMKMQARFIAPIITAVAATMALAIVNTLFVISDRLEELESQLGFGSNIGGSMTDQIALVSELDSSLPPTILLLIVSIYLIEVSLILAYFTNGIQHGFDEVNRDIEVGRTLMYAVPIFSAISIIAAVYITPFIANLI